MYFIGLDLGTSFIKGAILDLDAPAVSHVQRLPFPEPLPGLPASFCEVDADEVVASARAVIEALLPHAPDCAGIVLCTQMQSLVLTTDTGEPLSQYISWRDQRALLPHPSGAGTYYDHLLQRITPTERRRIGNELRPGLPLCALFWLGEQGRLPDRAIPASLADFVVARLCGSRPLIEPTNASVHGCFDLETGDWHWPLIERLGLERLCWPAVRPAGEVAGYFDLGTRKLPVYVPVGDQPCALAGALLQEGELSINVSTGSQVSLLSPELRFGDYQTRPFFDGRYLNLITHIPAGRALNLLVGLLGELAGAQGVELVDPWPYIAQAAAAVGETDLRVDPAFSAGPCGERGEISNIHEGNLSVGHLFRAAFAGMADNYLACARRLSSEAAWQRLVFSGGLLQKVDLLREIISARFGIEYRLCPLAEDTLLGLLALALRFSGRVERVAEAINVLSQASKGAAF